MPKPELLPGVKTSSSPPDIVFDSRRAMRRARRRALFVDFVQLLMLAGVDTLFVRWPVAHVPFLTRQQSLVVLLALNGLVVAHICLSRLMPRLTARRVASTWDNKEKKRFEEKR